MASGKNNISISSLLDSSSTPSSQPPGQAQKPTSSSSKSTVNNGRKPIAILEMVSKFQTSFNAGPVESEVIIIDDSQESTSSGEAESSSTQVPKPEPKPKLEPKLKPVSKRVSPPVAKSATSSKQYKTIKPNVQKGNTPPTRTAISTDQVKKFQTNFHLNPVTNQTSPSKTSITSIINIDDEPIPAPVSTPTSANNSPGNTNTNATKRKRANVKLFDPKKRQAVSSITTGETTATTKKKSPERQDSSASQVKLAQKSSSTTTGGLQKSPLLEKKADKTASGNSSSLKKQLSSLGAITDKNDSPVPVKLSAPSVIDLLNDDSEPETSQTDDKQSAQGNNNDKKIEGNKEPKQEETQISKKEEKPTPREKEKEKEKPEPPIIALNIPLLNPKDPQPGKAEVIVNVLKLAEEKYGWGIMHPKSKSAIDVMDDMIDDEDDDDNEDDDDIIEIVENQPPPSPLPSHQIQQSKLAQGANGNSGTSLNQQQKGKELTEEQLYRQHEVKMIRKVGKYDFEDPFIDDQELQMEEEISSTKEGFFVYWGPLVDDRNSNKKKKR